MLQVSENKNTVKTQKLNITEVMQNECSNNKSVLNYNKSVDNVLAYTEEINIFFWTRAVKW